VSEAASARTDAVKAARQRIDGFVRRTPIVTWQVPTPAGLRRVQLMFEHLQVSGSFKARGMFNAARAAQQRGELTDAGVVIASGGNAGLAAAHAAAALATTATVVVPVGTPTGKLSRLRAAGADVIVVAGSHPQSNARADEVAADTGALRLHAYDQDDVLDGAGTIALDILDHCPSATQVIVAVGGGGLVGGISRALTGTDVQVVAVEPTGAPTLHDALLAGHPVDVEVDTLARDSLGAVRIGTLPFEACRARPVRSVLVEDPEIAAAQWWLWDQGRILVEASAAAALASVMTGAVDADGDGASVIVLCGANVSELPTPPGS
jgi:threonine dehydratase